MICDCVPIWYDSGSDTNFLLTIAVPVVASEAAPDLLSTTGTLSDVREYKMSSMLCDGVLNSSEAKEDVCPINGTLEDCFISLTANPCLCWRTSDLDVGGLEDDIKLSRDMLLAWESTLS